jgi:hypothetical protein
MGIPNWVSAVWRRPFNKDASERGEKLKNFKGFHVVDENIMGITS